MGHLEQRDGRFLTPDGRGGKIREVLDAGGWPVILTHWQSLFSNGLETGLAVLDALVGPAPDLARQGSGQILRQAERAENGSLPVSCSTTAKSRSDSSEPDHSGPPSSLSISPVQYT